MFKVSALTERKNVFCDAINPTAPTVLNAGSWVAVEGASGAGQGRHHRVQASAG
jgi:hypothetical protein